MQAGTRVNAEQAPKRAMWESTLRGKGEDRWRPGRERWKHWPLPPGYWRWHA